MPKKMVLLALVIIIVGIGIGGLGYIYFQQGSGQKAPSQSEPAPINPLLSDLVAQQHAPYLAMIKDITENEITVTVQEEEKKLPKSPTKITAFEREENGEKKPIDIENLKPGSYVKVYVLKANEKFELELLK